MSISQQWLLVRAAPSTNGTRGGQQIYNTGLGKCLDVCTDASPNSQCGHSGNIYLQVHPLLQPPQSVAASLILNFSVFFGHRSHIWRLLLSSILATCCPPFPDAPWKEDLFKEGLLYLTGKKMG